MELIKQTGTDVPLTADEIAEKYNAKILFRPGEWLKLRRIAMRWFLECKILFVFQMIQECAIQFESKFVWAFGPNRKDSNQKDLHKIFRLNHVVLMPVSIFFIA